MSEAAFDAQHLAMMTGGDRALEAEVLAIFQTQSALWRRLMIAEAPVDTIGDVAHAMKGSARGLGLWRLARVCEGLERLARTRTHDRRAISVKLRETRKALDEALAAMAAARGDLSTMPKAAAV